MKDKTDEEIAAYISQQKLEKVSVDDIKNADQANLILHFLKGLMIQGKYQFLKKLNQRKKKKLFQRKEDEKLKEKS